MIGCPIGGLLLSRANFVGRVWSREQAGLWQIAFSVNEGRKGRVADGVGRQAQARAKG